MENKNLFIILLCLSTSIEVSAQKSYNLNSPNGQLHLTIKADKQLSWSLRYADQQVLAPSVMAIERTDYQNAKKLSTFGQDVKVKKENRTSVNQTFATPFYKKSEVRDCYNQLILKCADGYSIEFRAYNNAAAYRFVSEQNHPYIVKNEVAEFNFTQDYPAFIPYSTMKNSGERYCYSFESFYDEQNLSEMYVDSMAIYPFMVSMEQGRRAVVMENDLMDYPGMFLKRNPNKKHALIAEYAPFPTEVKISGRNKFNLQPVKRANYIARIEQPRRTFPWRTVLITEKDIQLLDNDIAQCLAPACRLSDTSWIKPGKVAWDWWNGWGLENVDFVAGINNSTYKKYIDFANANKLEYIVIDDGWCGTESLLNNINPNINLKELVAYGEKKNVGIILWSTWRNIAMNATESMEHIMAHYETIGIKGFKVDFFDRDDQQVLVSISEMAECAARHHLLLDLHGFKPTGIQRAYPNIVNFEGVKGLENCKWMKVVDNVPEQDFPRNDVLITYLRQLIGPMDYTPGAMMNATQKQFRPINDRPMSQGTRVHQMAMYTLYESPLQMLCDSPSRYAKEQECTEFIAAVPTTFDETIALDGKVGEYAVMARRKGDVWYIAALNNWQARDITIDFSFLNEHHKAIIFSDGVNAHRQATDYRREICQITASSKLNVHLAPGGGWTATISK